MKPRISIATIVEPTGVPSRIEIIIPNAAQNTEKHAEQIITLLKLLNTRIADNAGNITSADIKSDPTRFIASTMTSAIVIAIIKL